MIPEQYVWLTWSSVFLVPWLILYAVFREQRRVIRWASLFTMPFGLTEPLFVPEYWSPPSLFDLARRTGFDIESLIFCFAVGGVGAALYNVLVGKSVVAVDTAEKRVPLHRHHYKALAAPFLLFPVLYFLPWNPIYPGIFAMFIGAIANIICRPELKLKTWVGGGLFFLYYALFLVALEATAPGFIERVWNLDALSGFLVLGFPIEELLFAVGFGMYWSGVYEHFTWTRLGSAAPDSRMFRARRPIGFDEASTGG